MLRWDVVESHGTDENLSSATEWWKRRWGREPSPSPLPLASCCLPTLEFWELKETTEATIWWTWADYHAWIGFSVPHSDVWERIPKAQFGCDVFGKQPFIFYFPARMTNWAALSDWGPLVSHAAVTSSGGGHARMLGSCGWHRKIECADLTVSYWHWF